MKIAYLINQYPGTSHSFVRREIQALERAGATILRFAIRQSRAGLVSEEDKAEIARTRYILGAGIVDLAKSVASTLAQTPLRSLAAIASAIRLGWRSEAGLWRHGAYAIEALVLAAWLRRSGAECIHAHFGTNSATVAMLAAHIRQVPFSMTVHGPEEFDKPGLIGLKAKIESASFVVAVSNFGQSQLRRIVAPEYWSRLKIVHCGVDRAFYEGEAPAPPREHHFISVGRLSEQKGQITLVEAAGILKRKGVDFTVTLAGDGDMRGEIERAIVRHDVADRIFLPGWKSAAEVRREIEASRAFILPSYAEGLPVSIMEAFLLERPVISTYIAGIPELVTPGENGWLAPAGDAQALASAMEEAIGADVETLWAMGRRGKEKTLLRHDIDREAAKLLVIFRSVLEPGGAD